MTTTHPQAHDPDPDLNIDPSTLILREVTAAEQLRCWGANSTSWAGKLSRDEYTERERLNGLTPLGQNHGARYWGFVAPRRETGGIDEVQGDEEEEIIFAALETWRKEVVVKGRDGRINMEYSYGIASVFTPMRYRGRGIAGWMMRRLGEWFDGLEADCRFSVLFSDVGEYYTPLGWTTFPSLETSLPAKASSYPIPSTNPLTSTLLPSLCALDIAYLTGKIATTPLPPGIHTQLAFLPTYAQAAWHFQSEDFTASKLYMEPVRQPTVKGAISSSGRTWCYWVHDYNEDKLSILRIVSLDIGFAVDDKKTGNKNGNQKDQNKVMDEEQGVLEMVGVLRAAQAEAAEWSFKKVVLWNPDGATLRACKMVLLGSGEEPVVRRRTEGSIPCLRWKGGNQDQDQQLGGWEKGIDWVALEKYSWC